MTTTAKDLIQRAFGKRTANDPDRLASRPEMIRALSDYIRQLYVEVAELDEEFFPTSSDVTGVAGVWAIPSTIIAVFRVLDANGDEVSIVPFRDPDADVAPRVYQRGTNLYTVGETGDPATTAVLTLHGTLVHPELDQTALWDATANTLDASWPERHNELLVRELARYLAFKGGRAAEAESLGLERDAAKALLIGEAKVRAKVRLARWAM